jgi:predicted kinase
MKLIALAGLPGTGKSTLAGELARRLGAPLLDKDRVRAALFAPEEIEYSREQDDLVMDCIHRAVEFHARRGRVPAVVLDGRTYSRRAQVDELRALAARLRTPLVLIECSAQPAVVRARLERDARAGEHLAGNRSFELHERLRAEAEPIDGPKLLLATDLARLPGSWRRRWHSSVSRDRRAAKPVPYWHLTPRPGNSARPETIEEAGDHRARASPGAGPFLLRLSIPLPYAFHRTLDLCPFPPDGRLCGSP